MRVVLARMLLIAVGVSLHAGCAAHRVAGPADRFFLHKNAKPPTEETDERAAPPSPSLEEAIGKVRQLMATARPAPKEPFSTLETTDPVLAAALKKLSNAPTADNLYDVGAAYHRRGLLDQAQSYYSRSLRLDPRH